MLRLFTATIVAILASCALNTAAAEAESNEQPNIIFILADDLGYGDLGCFGQQKIQTPRLDQMAAEGMKLTQFYAGSTVCAPSRCVLMTGLHTGHCYIRGNGKINLRPQDITVAEVLKDAGYTCGLFGKWGLGHEDSTGLPTRQGFDYFFGYLDQHHAHNYFPSFLIRNGKRIALSNVVPNEGEWGQGFATKRVDYSHDSIMREAFAWLERNRDETFFMYLALTIPHANNERARATGHGQEIPQYGIYADKPWTEPNKGQAAMITHMDRDVGRLLDQLQEYGIDDNTLVIFSSDNGHHREGGNDPEFFDANGPLRGMKRDLYEGGIRVPTIVRWPGKVAPGTESDHIGYFGDLMATAAELGGVSAPAGIDSVSFAPLLRGQRQRQKEHDYLYWEFYEQGGKRAARQGKWKAIQKPGFDGPVELYNLEEDLGEEHNVAEEHPQIVAKMKAMMKEAHVPTAMWQIQGKPRASR